MLSSTTEELYELNTYFYYCCWMIQDILNGVYPIGLLPEWIDELTKIKDRILYLRDVSYGKI